MDDDGAWPEDVIDEEIEIEDVVDELVNRDFEDDEQVPVPDIVPDTHAYSPPVNEEIEEFGMKSLIEVAANLNNEPMEVLEMHMDHSDPNFKWFNFTFEEQAKVIVAARSNNEMNASKLKNEFLELLYIKESLIKYVFETNKNSA
ncbi:uncharacterized protein LOC131613986 [Vicia villosa]|uniref:uncharacterized protein LOC131613986 n=1 Tax=Vicia villosa TaxID=3911 RepID=UPI00273C8B74|nr:uncharacterized protein LOC131613986 [Vicia villosa]